MISPRLCCDNCFSGRQHPSTVHPYIPGGEGCWWCLVHSIAVVVGVGLISTVSSTNTPPPQTTPPLHHLRHPAIIFTDDIWGIVVSGKRRSCGCRDVTVSGSLCLAERQNLDRTHFFVSPFLSSLIHRASVCWGVHEFPLTRGRASIR